MSYKKNLYKFRGFLVGYLLALAAIFVVCIWIFLMTHNPLLLGYATVILVFYILFAFLLILVYTVGQPEINQDYDNIAEDIKSLINLELKKSTSTNPDTKSD